MAKKLCPICRVNTYGIWSGMVAKDGVFCGKCWDKFYDELNNLGMESKRIDCTQFSLKQIAEIIGETNYIQTPRKDTVDNEKKTFLDKIIEWALNEENENDKKESLLTMNERN